MLTVLVGSLILGLIGFSQDAFAQDLYVTSASSDEIKRYQGDGTNSYIGNFVSAGSGGLDGPFDLKFDAAGNLYVVSDFTNEILKYDSDGNFVSTFVSAGSGGLTSPGQITFGPDGNLYVSSSSNVLRYNGITGEFIDEFVQVDTGRTSGPGITFGPNGNLYVVSSSTDEILEYDGSTGNFVGVFVTSGSGGIDLPNSLTFGPDGNLYVTAWLASQVYRYDGTTGAFIDVVVTNSNPILNGVRDLTFGPDGILYVVSDSGQKVVKYDGTTGAWLGYAVSPGITSNPGEGGIDQPIGIEFGPDTADPEVSILLPLENEPLSDNPGAIVFSLSENSASGTITFTRTDGNPDSQLHVFDINSNSLLETSNLLELSDMVLDSNFFPLVNGAIYTIDISVTDPAGNVGAAQSANHEFDNIAPLPPIISSSGFTNEIAPIITGTAEAGSVIRLDIGGYPSGEQTTTGITDSGGSWSIPLPSQADGTALPDGTVLSLTAIAIDAAVNRSEESTLQLVIDRSAPDAPLIDPVANPTNDNTPTITGTAEAHSTVELFDGTTSLGVGQTDAAGNWSITMTPQADGTFSFFATATDRAGNISGSSSLATLTIDTVPPSISIVFPQDGDGIKSPTFSISGTSQDSFTGVASVDVSISDVHGFLSATGTDSWTFDAVGLSFGEHIVTARAYDNAGNFADASITITIRDLDPIPISPPPPAIPNNGFGLDLASGDVNGDGFSDLVTISENDPFGFRGTPKDSEVSVSLGSQLGLQVNSVVIPIADTDIVGLVYDPLAVGDLNGDGIEDIVVGIGSFPNTSTNSGKIELYFGSDPVDASVDLELEGMVTSQLGASVAIGDVNGDGNNDLIVGSPGAAGINSNGAVLLFFGDSGAFDLVPDSVLSKDTFPGNNRFGGHVATGDLNDDGIDDVIVSDFQFDADGDGLHDGEVRVFLGGQNRFDVLPGEFVTNSDYIITRNPLSSLSEFGFSLNVGDVNGDGIDDLAVGDQVSSDVSIYFGPAIDNIPDVILKQIRPDASRFGWDVTTGDINYDGMSDLLVIDRDFGGDASTPPKGSFDAYLSSTQFDSIPDVSVIVGLDPDGFNQGQFHSIITGDFDGDGGEEIAISDPIQQVVGEIEVYTCNSGGDFVTVDSDLDGLVNKCDNDDDNDSIWDSVDLNPNDISSPDDDFSDGTTTGTILDRGDRNWAVFGEKANFTPNSIEGVRIFVSDGTQPAQIQGTGICVTNPPTNISVIDPQGANFVLTCSSTSVHVDSGLVRLSAGDSQIDVVATLNSNQAASFANDDDGNLVVTNLNDSENLIIEIDGQEVSLEPNQSKTILPEEQSITLPVSGKFIGKHKNGQFSGIGKYTIDGEKFKRVKTTGAFTITDTNAKCAPITGQGTYDFDGGNTIDFEFDGEVCGKKFLSKGNLNLIITGGTGMFDSATGSGDASLIIGKKYFGGKFEGEITVPLFSHDSHDSDDEDDEQEDKKDRNDKDNKNKDKKEKDD